MQLQCLKWKYVQIIIGILRKHKLLKTQLLFRTHVVKFLNAGVCLHVKKNPSFSNSFWDLEKQNPSHNNFYYKTALREWNKPFRDREIIQTRTSSDLYKEQVVWCPWCLLVFPWLCLNLLQYLKLCSHHVQAETASQLQVSGKYQVITKQKLYDFSTLINLLISQTLSMIFFFFLLEGNVKKEILENSKIAVKFLMKNWM